MKTLRISAVLLSGAIATVAIANESAQETPPPVTTALEINNQWSVRISNSLKLPSPLFVTLRKSENHWEIDGIYDKPPKITKTQNLELFMATRDFQQWTNALIDMRGDCDKFEVKESDEHSVCTSTLAEKKTGLAIAGLFFGGSGKIPTAYTDDKVKAAINSIRPQQAIAMMTAFEEGAASAKKQAQAKAQADAAVKEQERRQLESASFNARKSAPVGAKDWCEQTVKQVGIAIQIEQTYTCQNYGVVTEGMLRSEGWAITNKKEREVGYPPRLVTVYDLAIEKVPR